MAAPVRIAASKSGSGPSSPQNLVPPSVLTVGSHDPEKTKKEKLQPTVDTMAESHGSEIRPCDDRKLKKICVQEDGQTSAANQSASCGSGPSSPQNLVPPSMSTVGSHDPEKPKKEKIISSKSNSLCYPQPTVDVTSMLMVESHGLENRPYNQRKLKQELVRDGGKTFAANQFALCVSPQYMPPMSQPYYQLPNCFAYGYDYNNEILEKDRMIGNQQDQICRMEQFISDLKRDLQKGEDELREMDQIKSEMEKELEKEKVEVCAKVSSLKEKEAELATCRRNLDHCETEKRRLEEKHRASLVSIIRDNERLNMELACCVAWNHEQSISIQSLQAQLEACTVQVNQLLFDRRRQSAEVERFKRLVRQLQHELANARERTQTHPDESRILLLSTQSGNASTQAALEVSQISAASQTDQNLTRSDAEYEHDMSVDGQGLRSGNLDVHVSQETIPDSVISPSAGEEQVISQENDTNTILVCWGSTGLTSEIRLDTTGQNNDAKEQ